MNKSFFFAGSLVSLGLLVASAPGCGDDTTETGTTTTTTTSTETTTTSGTGGQTGTGGGGTGGEGTGGSAALSCADYCATIATNCTGADDQWGETVPGMCEAVCATWEVGTVDDMSGNTLGCHSYHATAASSMSDVHCPHAGPTGGSVCGTSPCDDFCELAVGANGVCPGAWADVAACRTACMAFAAAPPYDASQTMGDTFACRMYHLTAAAADDTHCAHIVEVSATCQ